MMLKRANGFVIFAVNFVLCVIWHLIILFACIHANSKTFDSKRPLYREHKWEKGGKWYVKYLKINKWKDILPQRIGSDGFSKAHFTGTSKEYMERFILETCRGEWNHTFNCFYAVIAVIISPPLYGIIFGLLTVLVNLPFIAIQRYNRIRLLKLKRKLEKKGEL